MKVLVLNGSPKNEKSNTLVLTNAFLEGMGQGHDVEILHVYEKDINKCAGCFGCWTKTPGKCIYNDDMPGILEKIIEADLVIWSFPLYHFGMTAGLKALLERTLPFNLPYINLKEDGSSTHPERVDLSHQKNILISTCGFATGDNNYEGLVKQFNILFENCEKIICPQGELFRVPQLKNRTNQYLSYVKKAGEEFNNTSRVSESTQARLEELLYSPQQFIEMANADWEINDTASTNSKASKEQNKSSRFVRQMAAIYNKSVYEKDEIIEIYFTDLDQRYQLLIQKERCEVLNENFRKFNTKIETDFDIWLNIAEGKIDGEQAMLEGKYRVIGDLKIMMKMDKYFGGCEPEMPINHPKNNRETNMNLLLFPFIALWVGLPINLLYGGIAGILVASLAVIASIKYHQTVYEKLSIFGVIMIGVMAVLAFNQTILVCLSYLLFGVLWIISCYTKIPLTAYYSSKEYGGERAFNNELFLKTNRIITLLWGVAYICGAITSYFLLNSSLRHFTGLFNQVLPIIMGIFTVRFQKWYPEKIASGM